MTVPTWETLGLFAVAAAILIAIPGPNHLYIVSRTVAAGRGAGIASSLGVELATGVHLLLAAAGVTAVVAASERAFLLVQLMGAGYLLWLAWCQVRPAATEPGNQEVQLGGPSGWGATFRQGMLVNLLNPKVIIFFIAFLPQFLDPALGSVWTQVLSLGLVLITIGISSNLAYVLAADTAVRLLTRGRGEPGSDPGAWMRWLQAAVFVTLAVVTLLVNAP